MRPIVALVKCESYEEGDLLSRIDEGVSLCGGWTGFIGKGSRVLLKPNFLSPKPPEKAVTTHPALLFAVARRVREAGGKPFLGEIPGVISLPRFLRKTGLAERVEREGISVLDPLPVGTFPTKNGGPYGTVELARAPFEFDMVLNLPKVKTHAQMLLTLAVKNLFGFVPLKNRVKLHLQAGIHEEIFAGILLDIYRLIRPSLTILDGIVGMEGQGPASGSSRFMGFLAFSTDALALDILVSEEILGVRRGSFPLTAAAWKRGWKGIWPGEVERKGEGAGTVRVERYQLPPRPPVPFGLAGPAFLRNLFREMLIPRPAVQKKLCRQCLACVEACPPGSLKMEGKGLSFDYRRCIRCFCCQELCPEGAIFVRRNLLLRVLEKVRFL